MATLKSNDQTLNDFFKGMAQVSEKNKKWEEYIENVLTFWIRKASSTLQSVPGKPVAVKVYGSSAEGLKCCLLHDVGDVDLMIFPTAPEMAITEEMLENIDGKPEFVRIYGTNHPVLSRFRKEHSDFVSTATLRRVHPEIFGQVSAFAKLAAKLRNVISGKVNPVLDNSIHHFVQTADGPAVTMNFAQSFEPLSEQEERFKDERCYQNSPAALETMAAYFCESRGVPYTREHAELFNSYLEHCKEQIQRVAMDGRSIITDYPRLIEELLGGARVRELVQSREQLERGLAENAETGSAENENGQGSETGSVKNGSVVTCSDDTAGIHQGEDNCGLVNATGSSVSGPKERKMDSGLHDTESEAAHGGEASQPEPKARDNVGATGDVSDASQKKFDPATLLQDPLVAHLFDISDTKGGEIHYSAEAATHDRTGGADFVPAFQGRGWPQVAEEWCSRLRKWPSHEVIEEVTRNGFHVVAKAPKTDGNPELDFRLSFSHAEYLLSQELTALQKECYRCLKLYHRAFLRTERTVLTSYHLKTVLLWTAEETDLTLWREENRSCCVLLLLEKLQEALSNKVLPLYFIRSSNLFEHASKECPELLEMLSEKVERIRHDPTCFKWEMVLASPEPCAKESAKEGMGEMRNNSTAVSQSAPAVLPGTATIDGRQVEPPKLTSAAASPARPADVSAPPAYHPPPPENQHMSYHDFQDLYLDTAAEIASLVLSGADVPTDDPVLGELEADMRAMCQKHPELTSDEFVKMFKSTTTMAYAKFQMTPSADPIQRVLGELKGWMKMFRHCSDKELLSSGNEQAAVESLLDPRGGFDLGQVLPAGIGVDLLGGILNFFEPTGTAAEVPLPEDIPLD